MTTARKSQSTPPSRGRMIKALATVPFLPSVIASGELPRTTHGAQTGPTQQTCAPEPSPLAEAMTEVVRNQYGKNLSQEQLSEIKTSLAGKLRARERLRTFKLKNSDEPEVFFGLRARIPVASEDMLYSSVPELASGIRTRKISPIELTVSYLDRLEIIGPRLAPEAPADFVVSAKGAHW